MSHCWLWIQQQAFELKKMLHELADRGFKPYFSRHMFLEVVEKLCNKIAIIRQASFAAGKSTRFAVTLL